MTAWCLRLWTTDWKTQSSNLTSRPLSKCPGFVNSSKDAGQQQTLQSDSHFLPVGWCQNTISPVGYLKSIFCSLDLKYNHRTCSAPLVTLHFPTLVMDFPFPCGSCYFPFSATSYPSILRESPGLSWTDMGVRVETHKKKKKTYRACGHQDQKFHTGFIPSEYNQMSCKVQIHAFSQFIMIHFAEAYNWDRIQSKNRT